MTGRVTFVGAGPGRPDWVTQAGRAAIATADTLLVDALVSPALLSWAGWDTEIIDVGKRGGQPSMPQDQICELLVTHARQGRHVVRLKGGDPGTFGRLPEEIASLREHDIPCAVVPGISAAAAAAARAGISLTDRDHAASLTLLTGHRRLEGPQPELDWAAASRSGTGAVYMGILHAERNARRLIDQGVPPDTPVLVAEAVATDRERLVRTTLADLPQTIEQQRIRPPAIWIYGEVTRYASLVGRPLRGTVALFRPWGPHLDWNDALLDAGWQPVAIPLQRYEAPTDARRVVDALALKPDIIALSSSEAIRRLLAQLVDQELDVRALAGARIVVPGQASAASLTRAGLRPDVILNASEGMAALPERLRGEPAGRLLVGGDEAASVDWANVLIDAGWQVDSVPLYRKVARSEPPVAWDLMLRRCKRPICIWTSASQVELISDWFGALPEMVHVAIGKRTADALHAAGIRDPRVAGRPDVDAVLAELDRL